MAEFQPKKLNIESINNGKQFQNGDAPSKEFFNGVVESILNLEENGGNGGGTSIEVDSELSLTSTNPVQNKVIKKKIDDMEYTVAQTYTVANNAWGEASDARSLVLEQDFRVAGLEADIETIETDYLPRDFADTRMGTTYPRVYTSTYNAGYFTRGEIMVGSWDMTGGRGFIPVRNKTLNITLPNDPVDTEDSTNKRYVDSVVTKFYKHTISWSDDNGIWHYSYKNSDSTPITTDTLSNIELEQIGVVDGSITSLFTIIVADSTEIRAITGAGEYITITVSDISISDTVTEV